LEKFPSIDYKIKQILGSGHRIIDLGCGSGQLLDDLADQFEERIGFDISRARLNSRVDSEPINWIFHEADLNAPLPLEDKFADAVIANQVIEHIVDPFHFLSEIHRILRPGGCCIITTPNIRYLKHILHLLLSGYGPRTAGGNSLEGYWDDGHLHYFTHKDLRELFMQVGFAEVKSHAVINKPHSSLLRRAMDSNRASYIVREFLSGCILLWAIK
jgi:methionine biosynthesis protein MetW